MNPESDHDYHLRRTRSELDLAYRSECHAALEAHLRLSSLHMQCLKRIEGYARRPLPTHSRVTASVIPMRAAAMRSEQGEMVAVSG